MLNPEKTLVPCTACGQHHALADKACPHCNAPVDPAPVVTRIRDAQEASLVEAGITLAAVAAIAIAALNATGSSVNGLIQKVYGSSLSTVSQLSPGSGSSSSQSTLVASAISPSPAGAEPNSSRFSSAVSTTRCWVPARKRNSA